MSFFDRFKRFRMKTAKAPDLREFIGKTVVIDGQPVVISRIVGSAVKPTFYEINGEHLIGILRFHAQMNGDTSITEEQFKAFEDMVFHVERVSDKTQADLEKLKEGDADGAGETTVQ